MPKTLYPPSLQLIIDWVKSTPAVIVDYLIENHALVYPTISLFEDKIPIDYKLPFQKCFKTQRSVIGLCFPS